MTQRHIIFSMELLQILKSPRIEEAEQSCWEGWKERNAEGIQAYNARIAQHGLPLAKYRAFGQDLGSGRAES